jgi:Tfp pilus assembly protein PilF
MVLEIEGTVQVSRPGSNVWQPAVTNQVLRPSDQIRTGERSRAVVRLSDQTTKRLGEQTIIQIPPAAPRGAAFRLLKGLLYYFHRDKPGVFPVQTPSAYAVVLGTEFNLSVAENGTTTLVLIDGFVVMTNEFGRLELTSGEAAIVETGKAPARTAAIATVKAVQWCLYYPAILNVDELNLAAAEQQALAASLAAYRSGDLLAALAQYPAGRQATSDDERIYFAGLLLAVGQVEQTRSILNDLAPSEDSRLMELSNALRKLVAAVDASAAVPRPFSVGRELSTSFLAESYFEQSQFRLKEALVAARKATVKAPKFGFPWSRVAELEFSFGNIDAALAAVKTAEELSPRNPEALALHGFLLLAQNRINEAMPYFDRAIGIDGALGNAWLGRGLAKIRQGRREEGWQDLQVAATVEPQRAILRSYLGKAFNHEGDDAHAAQELRLAKEIDASDPTAWLYSALLNQQQNRINQAVRELEHSKELNENRRVYRSRLLLDQDGAVQGVNLAVAYDNAGLSDLAVREASESTAADPANYSAHLFLANSYQRLRDPNGVLQRFETPAINEYLLAALLAPVGAGTLAQSVSQQEYSKLFESDGVGIASTTEYLSRGAWTQLGAHYGTFGNSSYAVSGYYRTDPGQRASNDVERLELSVQFKQQITAHDSIYLRTIYGDTETGDVIPRYDPSRVTALRIRETQEPLLLAGYHREWKPGMHSLLLGGWFRDDLRVSNPEQQFLLLQRNSSSEVANVLPLSIEQKYRSHAEIFSAEAQQIWQTEILGSQQNAVTLGGRFQVGDFDTRNQHTNASFVFPTLFPSAPENIEPEFHRWTAYVYDSWRPVDQLLLVAGVSYDHLTYPANFRFAPLSSERKSDDQVSPKGGLIWTPFKRTTLRFGYSQSLGGVGFDQSFRLEPTQIAGFNQSFRSLIPESVAGANVDASFESWGVSLEQQIGSGTFVALGGELLNSEVNRQIGVYNFDGFSVTPGSAEERLDYRERALVFSLSQLAGDEWSFGARYRLSDAQLRDNFTDIPDTAGTLGDFRARSKIEALLHQVNLFAIYNHSSGFFGQAESLWYAQSNHGYVTDLPGDDFWQFNVFAGYRFLRRRAEARIGVLNITDQDYRLNPLNLTPDLPRDRTIVVTLRFNF